MAILWHSEPRAVERYSMAIGEAIHQVESASMASLRIILSAWS